LLLDAHDQAVPALREHGDSLALQSLRNVCKVCKVGAERLDIADDNPGLFVPTMSRIASSTLQPP
jgi:hypothetical protein